MSNDEEELSHVENKHWDVDNLSTLVSWVNIASTNLDILNEAILFYRKILQHHTILNLILSTLSGTLSVSQLNIDSGNYKELLLIFNIIFIFMTFTIAISSGTIKVFNLQEKLEKCIQLRQEWIVFGSKITNEIQLPLRMRKDALDLISKMKDNYTELFKQGLDVSNRIIDRAVNEKGMNKQNLTISDYFMNICSNELLKLQTPQDYIDSGIESGIEYGIQMDDNFQIPEKIIEPESIEIKENQYREPEILKPKYLKSTPIFRSIEKNNSISDDYEIDITPSFRTVNDNIHMKEKMATVAREIKPREITPIEITSREIIPIEKPIERSIEKPIERSIERSTERSNEKSNEKDLYSIQNKKIQSIQSIQSPQQIVNSFLLNRRTINDQLSKPPLLLSPRINKSFRTNSIESSITESNIEKSIENSIKNYNDIVNRNITNRNITNKNITNKKKKNKSGNKKNKPNWK